MMINTTFTVQKYDAAYREISRNSPIVTKESVFYAAWDLVKSGNRPTIERVRMRLGNGIPRGSPNTVKLLLQEWWTQLALHFEGTTNATVPGVPRRVAETLETLWREAVSAAADALRAQWADKESRLVGRTKELEHRVSELTEKNLELEERARAYREQLIAAIGGDRAVDTVETRRSEEAKRSKGKRRK